MENVLTYKEKMAFVIFVTLLRRMITDKKLGLNLYVPISKINENFDRAIKRNAFCEQKHFFRRFICESLQGKSVHTDEVVELTMEEWLNGADNFIGLRQVIKKYFELNFDPLANDTTTENNVWSIFNFLLARSRGEIVTGATYMRKFVLSHKDYKQDSEVS